MVGSLDYILKRYELHNKNVTEISHDTLCQNFDRTDNKNMFQIPLDKNINIFSLNAILEESMTCYWYLFLINSYNIHDLFNSPKLNVNKEGLLIESEYLDEIKEVLTFDCVYAEVIKFLYSDSLFRCFLQIRCCMMHDDIDHDMPSPVFTRPRIFISIYKNVEIPYDGERYIDYLDNGDIKTKKMFDILGGRCIAPYMFVKCGRCIKKQDCLIFPNTENCKEYNSMSMDIKYEGSRIQLPLYEKVTELKIWCNNFYTSIISILQKELNNC